MNESSPRVARRWSVSEGPFGLLLLVVGGALAACGSSESLSGGAKTPGTMRSTAIVHEPCELANHRVEVMDAHQDGKPEVTRVYDGQREICRISDLNGDGAPNMYEYFSADGSIRRREFDYDDNKIVNVIEIYEGNKLVRREMDTTNQGRLDTWDTFDPATGKIVRRERDSSLDGRIDQWWTWSGETMTVATDRDGDGNPDPDATITLGANGQALVPKANDPSRPAKAFELPPAQPLGATPDAGSPTVTIQHGGGTKP